jgi:hypothetical protein
MFDLAKADRFWMHFGIPDLLVDNSSGFVSALFSCLLMEVG